jgi:ribosomal protein L20
MPRVKRGTKRRAKRKKILERASGYFLTKSKLYRSAKEAVDRALKFAYSGRKQKKRQYRSIWIVRIGAAARLNGTELQPVHQRTEESGRRTGPQDSGGFGGKRCGGICASGGAGEEGERSLA